MTPAERLCIALRESRGFAHKRGIGDAMAALSNAAAVPPGLLGVPNGDDCAAIADGAGGHLLLAIEGFVEDFVEQEPWFAGYCGVMVNVSDVYAMGGRPIAVVDALWSAGTEAAGPLMQGMAEASRRYGVPVVGGHSNHRSARSQLSVAILGRAQRLLSSFDARPGDVLLAAVDLRGHWQEPYPYWNASTEAPAERLRGDLDVLPALAEAGLADAAKDISMAGAIGTALMLLDCSQAGACIDADAVPRPRSIAADDDAAMLRWLTAFPSYGFVLSVRPAQADAVRERFAARGIACAAIGHVTAAPQVRLRHRDGEALLWDLGERPFILAPREAGHG
ncbi:sll0787 family AIR synthase-like protein [Aquincola sp. MAHUQ-54]|uniref:Sll0787 family AIR synthase-like protein n=1 Tax=Aquincola agrisoli TaxID=3119538 RepID=A0AAW9QBB4_9BURK